MRGAVPLLATGSNDGTVRLWDLATRGAVASIEGFAEDNEGVAISPDGRMLATHTRSGQVKLWDVAARRIAASLPGHRDQGMGTAFSPDGKLLATSS